MIKENYTEKRTTLRTTTLSMLRKGNLFLLFLIAIPLFSLAQEKKAQDAYVEYFELPRESIFLHTNKTTYLAGEEIWFTAYAFDRKSNLTSKATTNIYVGLYDKSGKQIDKKLFLAKDGIASGNMSIDPKSASGEYFLKTSTNWMNNFKEDDSYVQKITFINPDLMTNEKQKISIKEYDVQFLPEGGHILTEVKNIIGIKAIDDQGKGTNASGVIVNSKGDEITNFKTNFLGLGKFSLTPEKGEKYTAKIILESSKEIEQSLPKAETVGFAINVNNTKIKDVVINLTTNSKSLELFKGQTFKLFIHKDGEAKIIPIVFDATLERVVIDKSGLFKGVNTVTLFNSKNKPLLERMFFNDALMSSTQLLVKNIEVVGDSINYNLASTDQGKLVNASISVLPNKTVSYNPKHNIVSSFYLNPYLKSTVENPQYYFKNFNQKRKYELDMLLLTQGWSRYDWDNVLNFPPDPKFDFENGITINGFLNTDLDKVRSLLMYPSELNKSTFIKFEEKGRFNLKNFYPIAGEELRFSYINKKGKTRKPGMALSFVGRMSEDFVEVPESEKLTSFYADKNSIPSGFIAPQNEVLDEIVVSAQIEKQKRRQYRLPFRGTLHKVDRTLAKTYFNLDNFLDNHGFVVGNIGLNPTRLGQVTIRHNSPRRGPVVIYLDNQQINTYNVVAGRTLDEFEDIYIDTTPNVNLVSIQGNPATFVLVVKLFSRKTSLWGLDDRAMQNITEVPHGFEGSKVFYTPKYIAYDIKPFQDYGVIHWQPRVITGGNSEFRMTTVNTGLEEVNFYIEGITSDGNVFSQVIKVDTTKKN